MFEFLIILTIIISSLLIPKFIIKFIKLSDYDNLI